MAEETSGTVQVARVNDKGEAVCRVRGISVLAADEFAAKDFVEVEQDGDGNWKAKSGGALVNPADEVAVAPAAAKGGTAAGKGDA